MTVKADLDILAKTFYAMAFGLPPGGLDGVSAEYTIYNKYDKYLKAKENGIGKEVEGDILWFNLVKKETMYQEYTNFLGEHHVNRGLFINNKNSKKAVIHIHGYRGNAENAQYTAKTYYNLGYSIFAADMRGQGNGEESQINIGIQDVDDAFEWIERLTKEKGIEEFILVGGSQGGGAVLNMVSHPDCPSSIKAVISDSGFLSLEKAIRYVLSGESGLGKLPGGSITEDEQEIVYQKVDDLLFKYQGVRISEGTNEERLKKAKVPLLVFYGEFDDLFPASFGPSIYQVYGADILNKSHVFFNGHNHSMGIFGSYQRYQQALKVFLQERDFRPFINQSTFSLLIDNLDDFTDEELDFSSYYTAFDKVDGDISDKISISLPDGITKEQSGPVNIDVMVENSRGEKLAFNSYFMTRVKRPFETEYDKVNYIVFGRFFSQFPRVRQIILAYTTENNNNTGIIEVAFDEHGFEYDIGKLNNDLDQTLSEFTIACHYSGDYDSSYEYFNFK